eukprot:m.278903 g.278903  ORF g.278903 m.278903 type:complete len:150 (+) comp98201_c0_seq1:151-600(+)
MTREQRIIAGMGRLQARLLSMNLRTVPMDDDGNCQFRAFSHQLYGTPDCHMHVRQKACDHIESNPDIFGIYFTSIAEFAIYVGNMRQEMTWGDELTLKAVTDAFGVIVNVITSHKSNWYLQYKPEKLKIPKRLFLAYLSPVHYDAVSSQ